jgi:hypothetical protein
LLSTQQNGKPVVTGPRNSATHTHNFFFILPLHVAETLINGLKRLEYRGYDSAGEQTPLACIATTTLRRPTHAPPGQSFCGRAFFQPRLLFHTPSAASQPASSTRDPHFFCALRWVRITQVFALLNYNVHSGSRTRTHSLTRLLACSRTHMLARHARPAPTQAWLVTMTSRRP